MTLLEFNKLSIDKKHEYLISSKDVRFLTFREYYNQKVSLWDCGGFFAEMYYFPVENKILRIEAFGHNDKRVDTYINYMNLNKKSE